MNDLKIEGICNNPIEALKILRKTKVDLIFLDIEMPELSGIEFLNILNKEKPLVVITSAYQEFALEGYRYDVLDYLLKPFSFSRFLESVEKARTRINLIKNIDFEPPKDYILVNSKNKVVKVKYDEILYIKSMSEYIVYHCIDDKIIEYNSLKKLEETLPRKLFTRIHKSYIIAIERVKAIGSNVVHIQKEKIPIGPKYKHDVINKLL